MGLFLVAAHLFKSSKIRFTRIPAAFSLVAKSRKPTKTHQSSGGTRESIEERERGVGREKKSEEASS
jgi:hypothetical protein